MKFLWPLNNVVLCLLVIPNIARSEPIPALPPKASCRPYHSLIESIEGRGTDVCSQIYTKTTALSGAATTTVTADTTARVTETLLLTSTTTKVSSRIAATASATRTVTTRVTTTHVVATVTASVHRTITAVATTTLTSNFTISVGPSRTRSAGFQVNNVLTPYTVVHSPTAFPDKSWPPLNRRQAEDDSWTSSYKLPDLRSACACILGVGPTHPGSIVTTTKYATKTASFTWTRLTLATETSTVSLNASVTVTLSSNYTATALATNTITTTLLATLSSTKTVTTTATATATVDPGCGHGYDSRDAGTGNRIEGYEVDVVGNQTQCCTMCGNRRDCVANTWVFRCYLLVSEGGAGNCSKDIAFGTKEGNVFPGPCGY